MTSTTNPHNVNEAELKTKQLQLLAHLSDVIWQLTQSLSSSPLHPSLHRTSQIAAATLARSASHLHSAMQAGGNDAL
jgi:hypothetical protein